MSVGLETLLVNPHSVVWLVQNSGAIGRVSWSFQNPQIAANVLSIWISRQVAFSQYKKKRVLCMLDLGSAYPEYYI